MLSVVFTSVLASTAHAQAPTVASPKEVFLEQRVIEELVTEGTMLSRLGVSLEIELVGDKAIVSLIDPATGRTIASTKVDALPADREAAVAQVTQVVSALVSQIALGPAQPAPSIPVVDPGVVDLPETKKERDERDAREYAFREEALSFGNQIAVIGTGAAPTTINVTAAYQGDRLRRMLDGGEFYRIVGRSDLAETFEHNRRVFRIGLIGGIVATLAGTVFLGYGYGDNYPGSFTGETERDFDDRHWPYKAVGIGLAAGGLLGIVIGVSRGINMAPVSEREIYDLAAQHNAKLRKKHNLPVSVTPYASESGGGVLVGRGF